MPFQSEAQRRWMYAKHPQMAKRWQKETPKGADLPEHVKEARVRGFFDELSKIAQTSPAFESAIQRGAGRMTPEAYAIGHADWARQQALKKSMAPAVSRYRAMQGRVAKKVVKPGMLKRLFRLAA